MKFGKDMFMQANKALNEVVSNRSVQHVGKAMGSRAMKYSLAGGAINGTLSALSGGDGDDMMSAMGKGMAAGAVAGAAHAGWSHRSKIGKAYGDLTGSGPDNLTRYTRKMSKLDSSSARYQKLSAKANAELAKVASPSQTAAKWDPMTGNFS